MFGLYTEKDVQKRIDETLARREEHQWMLEHFDRLDKQLHELNDRVRRLEGSSETNDVCCTRG